MDKSELEQLIQIFGEKEAKELLKLTSNYDSYIKKFKFKINKLLKTKNLEVKVGLAFVEKLGE